MSCITLGGNIAPSGVIPSHITDVFWLYSCLSLNIFQAFEMQSQFSNVCYIAKIYQLLRLPVLEGLAVLVLSIL